MQGKKKTFKFLSAVIKSFKCFIWMAIGYFNTTNIFCDWYEKKTLRELLAADERNECDFE